MSEGQSYIRIMSDIIESGVWAKLSSSAKTLYPVLLKFSDFHFKPVWPSTDTLLQFTGFKSKKSIIEAKRDLEKNGLLYSVSGSGRTSTKFYFRFDYKGSKIAPLGDTQIPLRGEDLPTSAVKNSQSQGSDTVNPNHIQITINNNHTQKTNQWPANNKQESGKLEEETIQESAFPSRNRETKIPVGSGSAEWVTMEGLLEIYGPDVFQYAYKEASRKGLQSNLPYLKAICKNRVHYLQESLKNGQISGTHLLSPRSWIGFLDWADQNLSASSSSEFRKLDVRLDGNLLVFSSELSGFQKNVIEKYFTEESESGLELVFASPKVENRIF